MSRHHEPRMVIDPRHDRRLLAVCEHHPAHHVHLPQLHRPAALPAPVVGSLPASGLGLDQPMAHQAAIHRRPTRQRLHTPSLEPEQQRARTPTRILPPQPHHQSLHLRRHLVRTRIRPRRRIRQPRQTPRRIPPEPSMHRLAGHPEPQRHIRHRRSVAQHLNTAACLCSTTPSSTNTTTPSHVTTRPPQVKKAQHHQMRTIAV